MKGLLVTIFVLVAFVTVVVVDGVCLRALWAWFLVPLGAPAIGTATAVGLSIFANLLIGSAREHKKADGVPWDAFAQAFMRPLVALGLGWFVRFFV